MSAEKGVCEEEMMDEEVSAKIGVLPRHRRQQSILQMQTSFSGRVRRNKISLTPLKSPQISQTSNEDHEILEVSIIEVEDYGKSDHFTRVLKGKFSQTPKSSFYKSTIEPKSERPSNLKASESDFNHAITLPCTSFNEEEGHNGHNKSESCELSQNVPPALFQSQEIGIDALCQNCGLTDKTRVNIRIKRRRSLFSKICFCEDKSTEVPVYEHYCKHCAYLIGKVQTFL